MGGKFKPTILLDVVSNNDRMPIVLRKDMESSITGTSVVDELSIIVAAHENGISAQEPLWIEYDPLPLDGATIAFTRSEGRACGTLIPF